MCMTIKPQLLRLEKIYSGPEFLTPHRNPELGFTQMTAARFAHANLDSIKPLQYFWHFFTSQIGKVFYTAKEIPA